MRRRSIREQMLSEDALLGDDNGGVTSTFNGMTGITSHPSNYHRNDDKTTTFGFSNSGVFGDHSPARSANPTGAGNRQRVQRRDR